MRYPAEVSVLPNKICCVQDLRLDDGRRATDLIPRPGYERLAARILSRLTVGPERCWLWTSACDPRGYGRTSPNYRGLPKTSGLAHRALYQALIGDPVEGNHLDHLCRRRNCCNPSHLDDVPPSVNLNRGLGPVAMKSRAKVCINGHEFTPANTLVRRNGTRMCRRCNARRQGETKRRRLARLAELEQSA